MKAKEFDSKFDEGVEDIIDDLDVTTARRVNLEAKERKRPPTFQVDHDSPILKYALTKEIV